MPDTERFDEEQREQFALSRAVVFQGALIAAGLLTFGFLLVALQEFLNPLLLGIIVAVLVWPLREHQAARSLLLAGGLVVLVWLLSIAGEVVLPFAGVYLLAYLLDPAVGWAERRWRVPRWASALGFTLVAVGGIVLFFVLLVPNIVGGIEELVAGLLTSLAGLENLILNSSFVGYLEEAGFVERAALRAQLTSVLPDQLGDLVAQVPLVLQTLTRSVSSIIALVTLVALVPVLLFYTLKDFPTIEPNLIQLFPTIDGERAYLTKVGHIVGSYLRGQIAISLIAAFNIGLVLSLFGVPFALLIGVLAGFLNLIPNVGAIITNVIGVGIALIFGTPVDVLVVVLVIFGQQLLEATVLGPNILSHQVGLHPVLVILSLLLFGATMGFLGLLIAVPVTAILVAFYTTFRERMTLDLADYSEPGKVIVPPDAVRPAAPPPFPSDPPPIP